MMVENFNAQVVIVKEMLCERHTGQQGCLLGGWEKIQKGEDPVSKDPISVISGRD
jgi:hypothetical protein